MNAFGDPTDKGWDVVALGIVMAVLSGLAWGILNGILVAKGRIPPLIVTLGTLGMAWGLAQIISGGQDIRYIPRCSPRRSEPAGSFGVPWLVIVAASGRGGRGDGPRFNRFGRYTLAIGSNKEAARRAGIRWTVT
jgi:ribose transport system permease protein